MSKTKLYTVVVLIALALLSLIAFQVYWVRNSYALKSEQFDQDVRRAIQNAMEENMEQRVTGAPELEFIVQDSLNMELRSQMGGFDTLHQSIHIRIEGDSFIQKTNGIQPSVSEAMKQTGWGQVNMFQYNDDEKSGEYLDNTVNSLLQGGEANITMMFAGMMKELDYAEFDSVLSRHLDELGLNGSYVFAIQGMQRDSLVYRSSEEVNTAFLNERENYSASMLATGIYRPENLLLHVLHKDQLILKRMWLVFVLSVLLVLVVTGGFTYLFRMLMQQKKLSEMKNDFINNMTHELKTPIANVGLSLEALLNFGFLDNPEKRVQYLGIAQKENKRLAGLVEQVLKAAAFEKGVMEFRMEEVDLHTILEKACQSFAVQIEEREGMMEVNLLSDRSVISGDPAHLSGVIFNLLDNANKYSPQSPEIRVLTTSTEEGIEVMIRDRGMGLNKADQEKIFDRFYRVNTGDLHNVKGYGLGLSYVAEVLRYHQATIRVESQLGEGSRFILFFPFQIQSL